MNRIYGALDLAKLTGNAFTRPRQDRITNRVAGILGIVQIETGSRTRVQADFTGDALGPHDDRFGPFLSKPDALDAIALRVQYRPVGADPTTGPAIKAQLRDHPVELVA